MKRLLTLLTAVAVGVCVGALVGFFSLDAQAWIYGPRFASVRYSGAGGSVRGLIEGAYAMAAGALVGARTAWLACGLVNRVRGGKRFLADHAGMLDLLVLGVFLVWMYLVRVSW
jgi:hypothetical protein